MSDLGASLRPGQVGSGDRRVHDEQHARLHPGQADAVSSGLDAVRHRETAPHRVAQRERAQALHPRCRDLERAFQHWSDEYDAMDKPQDSRDARDGLLPAANRTAVARGHTDLAQLCTDLAGAEPEPAEEHLEPASSWSTARTRNSTRSTPRPRNAARRSTS
ncbi:hypothetical protein [Streptomyces sp. NPDC059994]|uniref:hypothetical protein n=1 Tax=Streptomyces sp. NPDC059994 TaxID=3347029 RepID=UPI00369B6869